MLVLTRKIGEKIVIDGNIHLTILAVNGNQVRVGVTAPDDVSIWRSELFVEDPTIVTRSNAKGRERHEVSSV